jgi:SAM-dependent methyltransferase
MSQLGAGRAEGGPATTIRDDTTQRHLRKYSNKNPVQRLVLDRFFDAVVREIRTLRPRSTLDFGCGEGLFLQKLKDRGLVLDGFCGIDLRADALEHARNLHPEYRFECVDLLRWNRPAASFDLVIASEVLEHMPEPASVLARLTHFSRQHLLLTVPWEPWFRLMNLLRGRDIGRLGNHPEHVNLWSFSGFCRFLESHVRIVRAYTVFPFTVVVAATRGADH